VIAAVIDAVIEVAWDVTLSLVMHHLELSRHGDLASRSPTRTDTAAGGLGTYPSPPYNLFTITSRMRMMRSVSQS